MPLKSLSPIDEILLYVISSRLILLTFEIQDGTRDNLVLFIRITWKLELKSDENKLSSNDEIGSSATVMMYK